MFKDLAYTFQWKYLCKCKTPAFPAQERQRRPFIIQKQSLLLSGRLKLQKNLNEINTRNLSGCCYVAVLRVDEDCLQPLTTKNIKIQHTADPCEMCWLDPVHPLLVGLACSDGVIVVAEVQRSPCKGPMHEDNCCSLRAVSQICQTNFKFKRQLLL